MNKDQNNLLVFLSPDSISYSTLIIIINVNVNIIMISDDHDALISEIDDILMYNIIFECFLYRLLITHSGYEHKRLY